jgi:hypothetical protein
MRVFLKLVYQIKSSKRTEIPIFTPTQNANKTKTSQFLSTELHLNEMQQAATHWKTLILIA